MTLTSRVRKPHNLQITSAGKHIWLQDFNDTTWHNLALKFKWYEERHTTWQIHKSSLISMVTKKTEECCVVFRIVLILIDNSSVLIHYIFSNVYIFFMYTYISADFSNVPFLIRISSSRALMFKCLYIQTNVQEKVRKIYNTSSVTIKG
jgi:hypothetical protein